MVARGHLTTPLGLVDHGTTAFIEDESGGIALRLDAGDWDPLPVGSNVVAAGTLASHDGLLVVDLDGKSALSGSGVTPLGDALAVATGLACEPFEARVIAVHAFVTVAGFTLNGGGMAALVDDGTGGLSVIAEPGAGIDPSELMLGARVRLTGVLGQSDPAGTGGAIGCICGRLTT